MLLKFFKSSDCYYHHLPLEEQGRHQSPQWSSQITVSIHDINKQPSRIVGCRTPVSEREVISEKMGYCFHVSGIPI
jgi:hypothetical protein